MADGSVRLDEQQTHTEEKKPNEWPSRGASVSPLEDALNHSLDWGRIAHLRISYEFPSLVLKKDDEDLGEEISRPSEVAAEVKSLIRAWDEDPEAFVNPYAAVKEKNAPVRLPIRPQPKVEVQVKDR